jgi:hypothetical protein
MKPIVHIVPEGVFKYQWHGSYKDTISRIEFFRSTGRDYRQWISKEDDVASILDQMDSSEASDFVIEYSNLPRITKALRERFPSSKIVVRSHNLEALQHFDNHGLRPKGKGFFWLAYGMSRMLMGDITIKRHASSIWSISDWEKRAYWDRLPGRAEVAWLPYHCPNHLMPTSNVCSEGRNRIVCMPTSVLNRKSWDLVARFIDLAEFLQPHLGDRFEFLITGDLSGWKLPHSPAVRLTGMLDDLPAFLKTVRAVAMLSDLGYGFKTTICDSIAHGASILAHPTMRTRCPDILKPAILAVDSQKPSWHEIESYLADRSTYQHLDRALHSINVKILENFVHEQ